MLRYHPNKDALNCRLWSGILEKLMRLVQHLRNPLMLKMVLQQVFLRMIVH